MAEQSWFEPDHFVKHLDLYKDLSRLSTEELCSHLKTRWEAESGTPRRVEAQQQLEETLLQHLPSIERWADAPTEYASNMARELLESTWLEQLALMLCVGRDDMGGLITIEGEEEIQALAEKHGGIQFALAHQGPHFVVHLLLAKLGLAAFAGGAHSRAFAKGSLDWAAFSGIDTKGIDGIDFSDDFRAAMASLLGQGHSVTLYPEYSRSRRLGKLTVPFLGQTIHAPTGVARLAQAFQRPLVTVAMHRTAPFKYTLRFQSIGVVDPDGGDAAVEQSIRSLFGWLETLVASAPGQWDGWRWYHVMKSNGFQVLLRNLAAERSAAAAK